MRNEFILSIILLLIGGPITIWAIIKSTNKNKDDDTGKNQK